MTVADPIRFVKELELWAFSRGGKTCRWKTTWCSKHCYNRKFYRINPKLAQVDVADEAFWQKTSAAEFAKHVQSLGQFGRFRFAVRGEIWNTLLDISKVASILEQCPKVLFWIPTRAWRTPIMHEAIENRVLRLPNARVMASIDPTVSEYEEEALKRSGWSTVFTGDNSDPRQLLLCDAPAIDVTEKRTASHFPCTKTWKHQTGSCRTCTSGCFNKKRVDVHLKQHR